MRLSRLLLAIIFQLLAAAEGGAVVVTAVGDLMLAGSAESTLRSKGHSYAFEGVSGVIRNGDIAVANLEAPVTARGRKDAAKQYTFRSASSAAGAIRDAGFSVVTLANNHIMDYGVEGLADTLRHLQQNGIAFTGAGMNLMDARREAIVERSGLKVAFLAYSLTKPVEFFAGKDRPGTAPAFTPFFTRDIARARSRADRVVVSFHWGDEGSAMPHQRQVQAARAAVDAGADAVIGHHPHVLQGVEFYRGAPILYSLGNFAFGSWSATARNSVIARIRLEPGASTVELVPINVLNYQVKFRPVPLEGKRGQEVIENLRRLSHPMGTRIMEVDGIYQARSAEVR